MFNLQILSCPFIDGLDDVVIHELLLSPGDARLRLLEWLIARYVAIMRPVHVYTRYDYTECILSLETR